MTSTATEKARRWKRQLAFIYWALSPLLFPMLVRIFLFPADLASAFLGHAPPWPRWVVFACLVVASIFAGATMWFLWLRVRELPPPAGS